MKVNNAIQYPHEGLCPYRLVDVVHESGEDLDTVQSSQPLQNVAVPRQKLHCSHTVDQRFT